MTTGYNIREGSAAIAERIEQELHESGKVYECPGCGRALDVAPPADEAQWVKPEYWCRSCGGRANLETSRARRAKRVAILAALALERLDAPPAS
jgi:hypothetical protein